MVGGLAEVGVGIGNVALPRSLPQCCTDTSGFQRRPSVRDEERDVEVAAPLNRSSSHSL